MEDISKNSKNFDKSYLNNFHKKKTTLHFKMQKRNNLPNFPLNFVSSFFTSTNDNYHKTNKS